MTKDHPVIMTKQKIPLEKYIEKLEKRIPKNLIIEGVSDKKINVANEYLKSRKKHPPNQKRSIPKSCLHSSSEKRS